jgi:hypothetical protein
MYVVGCGLARNIGGDRGDAQPGADGIEPCGAAGNDRHPGAVRHERLDQSQAEATASASDDDTLIFETPPFCSCVQVQLSRLRYGKGVNQCRRGPPPTTSRTSGVWPTGVFRPLASICN